MIHRFLFVICILCIVSCSSWETEKIPAEQYFSKKWEAIDLHQVTEYPYPEACKDLIAREAIKKCFEREIKSIFYNSLAKSPLLVTTAVDDTLWIDMIVNEKGSLCIDSVRMQQSTRKELPLLESYVFQTAMDMPTLEPATLEGTPVKVKFRLPVILKVD